MDYYFGGALSSYIARGQTPEPNRPVVRAGPNTLLHGRCVVIFRYVNEDELDLVRDLQPRQVFYLIDDLLPLAHACAELPPDYRRRLTHFARNFLPRILALNPTVVAPSEAILAQFPDHVCERLDPALLADVPNHQHFVDARPFRLAFLGTRSHANGLDFLVPIIEQVLASRRNISLTLFFGRHLPARLARHPGVENHRPLSWGDYQARMTAERFHVLLAPLPDTTFNRGRSLTKLMEAAVTGAVLMASSRVPFSGAIKSGRDGLLLGDDPAEWVREIRHLADDRDAARDLAEGTARLARKIGDPARLAHFWRQRLGF